MAGKDVIKRFSALLVAAMTLVVLTGEEATRGTSRIWRAGG